MDMHRTSQDIRDVAMTTLQVILDAYKEDCYSDVTKQEKPN
jgi:hypothetical protein